MSGRVLIIDDLATNRIILKVKLSSRYYEVAQASSLTEACDRVAEFHPDLILLSGSIAGEDTDAALKQLRQVDTVKPAPVVLILDDSSAAARIQALKTGVDEVLSRPLEEKYLLARLRSLLRQRHADHDLHHHAVTADALGFSEKQKGFTRPGQIVLITQDRVAGHRLQMNLSRHVRHSFRTLSGDQIMSGEWVADPDVYILHVSPQEQEESLRMMADLRASPGTRRCPIIAFLPRESEHMAATLLDLGAADVILAGTDPLETSLRLSAQLEVKRMGDRMRDQLNDSLQAAVLDPLTGLHNRRYALSYLDCLLAAEAPEGGDFAVILADLDHFKQVNDTYGHPAGDAVLARVAAVLRNHVRCDDLVARIGGEEFLIIVPGTTCLEARKIASGLCQVVGDTAIALPGRVNPVHVTISIGLTLGKASGRANTTARCILEQADRALYRSKAEGRNTVTLSTRSAA